MFITEAEIVALGLDSFYFLCCAGEDNIPSEYIFGSFFFKISKSTILFLQTLRTISIPHDLIIVCYDNSKYNDAAKVYWGLKAVGFNARVLIKVLKLRPALVIVAGVPKEVDYNKLLFRDIRFDIITTKEIQNNMKHKRNHFKINYLSFEITNHSGTLIAKDIIKNYFKSIGWKSTSDTSLIIGNKSCIGGLLLYYIGNKHIQILIDEPTDLTKDYRSESKDSHVDDSFYYPNILYDTGMNACGSVCVRSLSLNQKNFMKTQKTQSGCARCELFWVNYILFKIIKK